MTGWVCPHCGKESRVSYRCDKCETGSCLECIIKQDEKQLCPDCAKEAEDEL